MYRKRGRGKRGFKSGRGRGRKRSRRIRKYRGSRGGIRL